MIEFRLMEVKGRGWLGKVMLDDKEVYRGEFKATAEESLSKAQAWRRDHIWQEGELPL